MFGDLFKKKQFDEKGPAPQNPQGAFAPNGQMMPVQQYPQQGQMASVGGQGFI